MISRMRCSGDLSSMECTVRSKTDHASLWKHTITDVWGRLSKYLPGFLHLKYRNNDFIYINTFIMYTYIIYDMLLLSCVKRIIIINRCLNLTYSIRTTSLPPRPHSDYPKSAPYSCFCPANGSKSNEYQLHVHRTDVTSLTDALSHSFSLL